jgi:radical SAM-linked protein
MIGLPTETKEDVAAILDLIERVIQRSKGFGKIQLNISVSPHSPKSHTPFQWEKQDTKEDFKSKVYLLKDRLKKYKQVKLSWRDEGVSQIECALGRGDRRIATVIHNAWVAGARFDGWNDHFRFSEWENAFSKSGLLINYYTDEIPQIRNLPWDHIDKGVTRSYLLKERQNAYREKNLADCKDSSCYGCGIQRKSGFADLTRCYIPNDTIAATSKTNKSTSSSGRNGAEQVVPEDICHYRMHYSKGGYDRYLSHLDMVRVFERASRRAGIRVAHSQGFNPRPKFAFGPPLRLGYSSEAEYADFQVFDISASQLKEKLNSQLPPGIRLLDIIPISPGIPSLMTSINAAEYAVNIGDMILPKDAILRMFDMTDIQVMRRVKGKIKAINIRPYLESIENGGTKLTVLTKSIDGRTVRIDEILHQLFGTDGVDTRSLAVHRQKQMIKTNGTILTPMEIR